MRDSLVGALLLPEENKALKAALSAYRKQTGDDLTRSDVVRHGVKQFVLAMGQAWPGEASGPAVGEVGDA